MMKESKLTNFQQRHIMDTMKSKGSHSDARDFLGEGTRDTFFFFFFFFLETGFLCVALADLELCKPGWPRTDLLEVCLPLPSKC